MKLKEILKKNNCIRRIVKKHKIKREYLNDFSIFNKYYNDSSVETIEGVEYKILLLVHSLEKGMCHKELRPFGEKKINELIILLKKYLSFSDNYCSSFLMGIAIIDKWINIYDANDFDKSETYSYARDFLNTYRKALNNSINVGSCEYDVKNIENQFKINYYEFIKSRHSVREFLKKDISSDDINYCVDAAILTPTACNRQMIKIYSINTNDRKKALDDVIMGLSGFEKENIHYFVVTFDVCAFSFYGERNQGYFNAGLVAMNFVNALHSKKIGSCFLQWGNTCLEENKIKSILGIPNNERIAVIIASGYYKEKSIIPCSNRKLNTEVFKEL